MAKLTKKLRQFYREEDRKYWISYSSSNTCYVDGEPEFVLKKLCRHFNVEEPELIYKGNRGGGEYYAGTITLKENFPSIGLLIHEFSHHLVYILTNEELFSTSIFKKFMIISNITKDFDEDIGHGSLFEYCRDMVQKYAKSKNYWQKELLIRRIKNNIRDYKYNIQKLSKEIRQKEISQRRKMSELEKLQYKSKSEELRYTNLQSLERNLRDF